MENIYEQFRNNVALHKEIYEEKKRSGAKNDSLTLIAAIGACAALFCGVMWLGEALRSRNEIVRLSAYESESCFPYVEVYRGNEKILSSCGWPNELEEIIKKASQ
jgi:hypothetical protein